MKIIQNNKEYGYQQPIINDIDVLGEATITSNGQQFTLAGNLSSYARVIITLSLPGYSSVTNSIDLSYADFKAGKQATFDYGPNHLRLRVMYVNDTTVKAEIAEGNNFLVKIEGVKRAAQVPSISNFVTVLTGTTGNGTKSISAWPDGFNKYNSVVCSIGIEMNTGIWRFFDSYGESNRCFVSTSSSGVSIYTSGEFNNKNCKITLLKVS